MKIGDICTIAKRRWICTNRIENAVFLCELDNHQEMIMDARHMGVYL